MNFSEASKDGKKVRRPTWLKGMYIVAVDGNIYKYGLFNPTKEVAIATADLLATDWELYNDL
jgi:hypothetical protein